MDATINDGNESSATPGIRKSQPAPLLEGFLRNMLAGVRLTLFCRTGPEQFSVLPGDLILLCLADPALNILTSWLLTDGKGAFTLYYLPPFFFHIPLFLLCGLAAARLAARPVLVTAVPVAFVSLSLSLEALHGLAEWVERSEWIAVPEHLMEAPYYYRFFLWWTAAATLFLLRLMLPRRKRMAVLIILFLAIVVAPLLIYPRSDLWNANPPQEKELQLTEEVLDSQPRLMEEALGRIHPGRSGVTDLYFVGFAGDGSQDVFMRELLAVERLLGSHFGTSGRSVVLVNNPVTELEYPFATATNLRRTLHRIGEVMDRDEDILFLFLTSHGSSDGELAVENGPLELTLLTPEKLRSMLAEAGIKWRVITVSSCYSGTFIEPLADDNTLIMTASDATHESFGCQNGSDFTWFGKAYFDESLRTTSSFTEAFGLAQKRISIREKTEGETPSNPQMFLGKGMKGKLAEPGAALAASWGKSATSTDPMTDRRIK